jgi:uncharacterized integral membrane protein (TIGR00697 family)
MIAANIQVLKTSEFIFSSHEIALGTILFASTFIVSDILTEHKGVHVARKGVHLSIIAQLLMSFHMFSVLIYPNGHFMITGESITGANNNDVQHSLYTLFTPSMRILFSSLLAYYVSQILDISIYKWISSITHRSKIWLRFNISNFVSGFVDNFIFSLLAWVILAPNPIGLNEMFFTYIMGAYLARIAISVIATPIMYFSKKKNDL